MEEAFLFHHLKILKLLLMIFSTGSYRRRSMKDTVNMSVSQVFTKNGEKYAFVSFTDGTKNAEGRIPECKITSNNGFAQEEVKQLEDYMGRELTSLKKMAAGVNVMRAFMKP